MTLLGSQAPAAGPEAVLAAAAATGPLARQAAVCTSARVILSSPTGSVTPGSWVDPVVSEAGACMVPVAGAHVGIQSLQRACRVGTRRTSRGGRRGAAKGRQCTPT